MALVRGYVANDTAIGAAFPDAYIRVRTAQVDKENRLTFVVDWYVSEAWAKSGQKSPWKSKTYVMEGFDHGGANPKTQAYAWLKTQPEFVSCSDC